MFAVPRQSNIRVRSCMKNSTWNHLNIKQRLLQTYYLEPAESFRHLCGARNRLSVANSVKMVGCWPRNLKSEEDKMANGVLHAGVGICVPVREIRTPLLDIVLKVLLKRTAHVGYNTNFLTWTQFKNIICKVIKLIEKNYSTNSSHLQEPLHCPTYLLCAYA